MARGDVRHRRLPFVLLPHIQPEELRHLGTPGAGAIGGWPHRLPDVRDNN